MIFLKIERMNFKNKTLRFRFLSEKEKIEVNSSIYDFNQKQPNSEDI